MKSGSDHDLKARVVLNAGNYSDSTNTCPTMSIVQTGGLTDNEHRVSSAQDHGVGLPNTAQLKLGKLGAQAEGTGSKDRLPGQNLRSAVSRLCYLVQVIQSL